MQLGDSSMSYMTIRVSFSHSAFPDFVSPETVTGVSNMRSRMETTAIATLKRHNTLSPWSPPPAPAPNPLFQLIERHWGVGKATQAMQEVLTQRSTPRKPAEAGSRPSFNVHDTIEAKSRAVMANPPTVLRRQASLQRGAFVSTGEAARKTGAKGAQVVPNEISTPTSTKPSTPSCSPYFGGTDCRSTASRSDTRSNENKGSRRWRKGRSLGVEALRNLVPMLADLPAGSRERDETRSLRGATVRVRGKRESGIWNWGNWF